MAASSHLAHRRFRGDRPLRGILSPHPLLPCECSSVLAARDPWHPPPLPRRSAFLRSLSPHPLLRCGYLLGYGGASSRVAARPGTSRTRHFRGDPPLRGSFRRISSFVAHLLGS